MTNKIESNTNMTYVFEYLVFYSGRNQITIIRLALFLLLNDKR